MEMHGVFLLLGALAGAKVVFFQMSYYFSEKICTLSFCSSYFCVPSVVSTLFLSTSTYTFVFPSQPALLEPPLIFPHHFYFWPDLLDFSIVICNYPGVLFLGQRGSLLSMLVAVPW